MCKAVKCPQCGHEFTPEQAAVKTGAWTPEEDELLLNGYQKERRTIAQLAEELNRTQDATRNRLFVLRGGGKPKGVTAAVQMTAKEYDEMRAARTEVKNARKAVAQVKATERELSAFYSLGTKLLDAKQNKRAIAPLFAELQKLVDNYENY